MRSPEILECSMVTIGRHDFPVHVHPNYITLSLITEGSANLQYGGRQHLVKAGDIVIIPPNLPHKTRVLKRFTYKVVRIKTKAFSKEIKVGNGSVFRNKRSAIIFSDLFDKLHSGDDLSSEVLLDAFQVHKQLEVRCLDNNIYEALKYMQEHVYKDIKLKELSRAALMSESHFHRIFKKQFLISPNAYLQSLRIDAAKELINAGQSLTDVGLKTGYYDQSHFIKYFKRLAGMNPKEFRSLK